MWEILTTTTGIQITSKWEFITPEVATGVVTLLESRDYYLAHPSQRPKTDIADYVESQGFLVPRRYKNIDEALASGKDFIMRSEHPQDYDGVSWLFESMVFYASMRNVTQEELQYEQSQILALEKVKEYCKHTWKNYEEFISQASFEYWEYIEWENLTLVRDEAVEWRYHIFINDKSWSDYICYDSGSTIQWNIPENIWVWNIKRLIEQYEKISRLPRFDILQCPNIEFQLWDDGDIYFLQYKRGHQKELHNWTLERELEEWEVEAQFVRGVTKKWWEFYQLELNRGIRMFYPKGKTKKVLIDDYIKRKQSCVISYGSNWDNFLDSHGRSSQICHSGTYVFFDIEPVREKFRDFFDLENAANRYWWKIQVQVFVESDGLRAIVKFELDYDIILNQLSSEWLDRQKLESYVKDLKTIRAL